MPPTPSTAAPDPSEPSLKPGDTLRDGRYAISGRLGEGGQATTFDAVDKSVGRRVTVKRFRVRGASSWKEVELAEREAKVLAHIQHESLPVYVDHFEEGGSLYLVTEHIEGETVAAMRAAGPIEQDEVLRFLADAAGALDYLHGRSPPLVHRDIKPSNVIRRPDGSFAIIDFGAVRDRLKVTGSTVVGTFGFMAPEQFQGRAMPASDVYAVGATAVAMLAGTEPEDLPHKGLAIDVETALAGSVDPALIRALASMVEPDPDRRAQRITPLLPSLQGLRPRGRGDARDPRPSPSRSDRRDEQDRSRAAPSHDPGTQRSPEGPGSLWDEPARWNQGARVRTEASRQAERVVNEAEIQVKRVVEEVGDQVRRVVAEVSAGRSQGARREAKRVAEVAKREAKRAFQEARRAGREAERAGRDEARRAEAEARREEAERRRESALARLRARRAAPLGGPVLLLVLLALTIAQLAVLLALKILTPMVLYLVSGLFFGSVPGRAMRAAARHVSGAGTRANTAIGRAKDLVRGKLPPETPAADSAAPQTPVHVIGDGPVDPYAHTHVSSVGRKEPAASGVAPARFPQEPRPNAARIEDERGAEEEADAEDEARDGARGRR